MLRGWFKSLLPEAQKPAPITALADLKDIVFVDLDRLDTYVDQLGSVPSGLRKETRKLSGSLAGPTGEISVETVPGSATTVEKIRFLTQQLSEQKRLYASRKDYIEAYDSGQVAAGAVFVRDQCLATPLFFPASSLPPELGLKAFRVWLSETDPGTPNPGESRGPDEGYGGSIEADAFLFLTELIFDTHHMAQMTTGHTVLHVLLRAMRGEPFPYAYEGREPMPTENPDEILIMRGAIKGEPRMIETLYRIRYVTNEQFYYRSDGKHRSWDILGYPLYIAT